jgi:DNA-binding IclR family transcriptional regulator
MQPKTISTTEQKLPRAAIKPLVLDYDNRVFPDKSDRKFVTALARGLDILRAFQSRTGPMSNKELSEVTGIPKPTISRLTYTLVELGYLIQATRNGKYELSPGILSLGYPLLSGLRVRHVAHDHMAELAKIGGCTVALAARDHISMVFVDEYCGNSSTTLRVDVGARIEIARSAIGRAYLAGLGLERRNALFEELESHYGSEWKELKHRIDLCIQQVDERGFCIVDREWRNDTRTVAAPLVSQDGLTVMAMSCGGPTFSVTTEALEEDIGPRLVHISRTDSLFLGN